MRPLAHLPIASLMRRVLNLVPRLALKVLNLSYIEHRLLSAYNTEIEKHKPFLPRLNDSDAKLVDELERRGVAPTSLSELDMMGTSEMYNEALQLKAQYAELCTQGDNVTGHQTTVSGPDIFKHPAIFNWGAQRRLLDLAEVYLGLPVSYNGVHAFYTVAGGEQTGTHVWHRDREDRRMLKIGVYFHDVKEDDGPLQILARDKLPGDLAADFTYPIFSHEDLQKQVGREIDDSEIITCVGPSGAVFITDTARNFHRGKPVVSQDRFVIYFVYFARQPRHPFYCYGSGLSLPQIKELAASLPAAQRECVLWRDKLPFLARLLRPNLLRAEF